MVHVNSVSPRRLISLTRTFTRHLPVDLQLAPVEELSAALTDSGYPSSLLREISRTPSRIAGVSSGGKGARGTEQRVVNEGEEESWTRLREEAVSTSVGQWERVGGSETGARR